MVIAAVPGARAAGAAGATSRAQAQDGLFRDVLRAAVAGVAAAPAAPRADPATDTKLHAPWHGVGLAVLAAAGTDAQAGLAKTLAMTPAPARATESGLAAAKGRASGPIAAPPVGSHRGPDAAQAAIAATVAQDARPSQATLPAATDHPSSAPLGAQGQATHPPALASAGTRPALASAAQRQLPSQAPAALAGKTPVAAGSGTLAQSGTSAASALQGQPAAAVSAWAGGPSVAVPTAATLAEPRPQTQVAAQTPVGQFAAESPLLAQTARSATDAIVRGSGGSAPHRAAASPEARALAERGMGFLRHASATQAGVAATAGEISRYVTIRTSSASSGSEAARVTGAGTSPAYAPDVAAQVAAAAQRAAAGMAGGGASVRLQLDPPQLGHVQVTLRAAPDGIVAVLRAENPAAIAALQGGQEDLRQRLGALGFKASSVSVVAAERPRLVTPGGRSTGGRRSG